MGCIRVLDREGGAGSGDADVAGADQSHALGMVHAKRHADYS